MTAAARGGTRWSIRVAVLGLGLLAAVPPTHAATPDTKKPQSKGQLASTPQTSPKSSAKRAPAKAASPPKATAPASRPVSTAARPPASRAAADECVHVVKRGETLAQIATRQGVTRDALAAANKPAKATSLKVGQRLTVPGCRPAASQVAEALPTPAPGRAATASGVEPASLQADSLIARVGPRRIPTRLHIGFPEFGSEGVDLMWPVEGPVVSGFGRRRGGWHAGIDIRAERGTAVRAAAPGVVVFSGWETFYGKVVKIEHPGGFMTLYAHNLENLVQVGDLVDTDTVLATVGRTGRATGDHLHFEIRRGGMAFNPAHLLEPRDTAPTLVANPYLGPEPDQIPVSSLVQSPDDFEHP